MKYQYQPTCQIPPEVLDGIYMDAFGFKTDGAFVEIGAHDGWHWSCSWGLAEIGWHGLYAEPVKALYEECRRTNAGRPNVRVVDCCIGKENGMATLGMAEYGASAESTKDTFEAVQYRLDDFLDMHGITPGFDLLVIDVEGSEEDVLSGFSPLVWMPKLVIIERPAVPNKLTEAGYKEVYSDWINNCYVAP